MTATFRDDERRLLKEISALANRARDLRQTDAVRNHAEVKLLTGDLQAKWQEMRALRATPVSGEVSRRSRSGSHG